MKYLQKSFTIAVTSDYHQPALKISEVELVREPGEELLWLIISGEGARRIHKKRASQPHEYLNGGVMCQLCGLGDKAKIHEEWATRQTVRRTAVARV